MARPNTVWLTGFRVVMSTALLFIASDLHKSSAFTIRQQMVDDTTRAVRQVGPDAGMLKNQAEYLTENSVRLSHILSRR